MYRRSVFLAAVLVPALCVSLATAQQQGQGGRRPGGFGGGPGGFGGGPGGGGPGGGGPLSLLQSEQVQKELELLPDQIADFGKVREEMGGKMRELFSGTRDLSDDERRKKFEEMRPEMEKMQKEMQAKIKDILLPHQNDRLRELFVQVRGAAALEDADIAAELKLSDDQKKQVADVREKQREKMGELFRNRGEGGGNEDRAKQFETLRDETTKLTMDVLSSAQREQFEKMKGEKADFDVNQLRFGGQGGPGGRGGPGGGFRGGRPGGGDRPGGNRPEGGNRPGDRPASGNNDN